MQKVVLHNSISIDGSLTNFEVNMPLHYQIVANYQPELYLVGSNTIKVCGESSGNIPIEEKADFNKPKKANALSYWVIPDSTGSLKGLLHFGRRCEYCKDVIILLSEKTPKDYLTYLKERNYDYFIVGQEKVNLTKAFDLLSEKYCTNRIIADTGKILSNLLLEQNLVSQISLLIHPTIVGKTAYRIFDNINLTQNFKLIKKKIFPKNYVWLVYEPE
ncbi:MAG: 5-amino-6-(5-phosphoribosylamino)uracil reductase [Crenarchaeota archaeon]|nr:5-amino-6-(5-phosphoribosylamino)uracil reductase [Thermoproteota archaeon]